MSSKENPCRKFQANIFNKSKCQNCFKPRESHSLSDEDLNQAKPIYGGWLLLAPEGTNFDNPLHRSRKWQRRFFILYEHGLLRYALDEMPSTLPQGTINMNQCSDVIDGEARTGQKFSLCILTPEKEHFIRAENKEIISGWLESLVVYPRTNKQNLKKKRKVEPPTPQEPGPAKVTVTSSGGSTGASLPCLPSSIASVEKVPASRASLWQEERRGQAGQTAIPCSRSTSCLSQLGQGNSQTRATRDDQGSMSGGRKARVESGYFSLEKAKPDPQSQQPPRQLSLPSASGLGAPHRRSQIIEKFETFEGDSVEQMETSSSSEPPSSSSASAAAHRQGRSERRHFPVKPEFSLDSAKEQSMPDVSSSSIAGCRRAKSLDRRATESSMTPDLLNFKKGWMTKLYEDGLWKKHWFVLTDQSLRYYRDSVAEEAADLDGEIDLSTCHDVTEFPVQRNYGFQIHTKEGAFTLSAMTSGIRRNWIQAIMKNVRPTIAPDVTRSLPEERAKVQASMDLGHEPPVELRPSSETSQGQGEAFMRSSVTSELRRSRIRERHREGRSKTFDWAEFCHGQSVQESSDGQPLKRVDNVDISSASSSNSSPASSPVSSASSGSSSVPLAAPPLEEELERDRTRRREERRRRVLNTQSSMPVTQTATAGRDARAPNDRDSGRMEVERSLSMPEVCSEGGSDLGKPANVQVEIEQRWHQVETTPLREEKQVPIATIHSSDPTAERLPPQELAALLDKELEQAQKELTKLQEQNKELQEQLQAARGRELSAREGYVLQSDSLTPSPHTGGWHRLHKLNQDLQTDLEAQRRKQDLTSQQVQALKRNYSEAKDVIRHHEAQIQALQTKLNNALAEILISEQAVAKMRSELKLEQERFRERKEEWEHNELTLRAQLKDSEDRLKDVEAHLLEKSQALRDLERQQALQRDHLKEVQKLQERLTEVTGRLIATEEAHALKEERLQKNLFVLQESQEKERQGLVKSLAETELRAQELEDRLQEAEQQVETLLLENQTSGLESNEVVHQLEEQLAIKSEAIAKLTETVRQLEEEKGRLTCRCQELLNQIAEADNEVNKLQARLKTEETDYYNLEHSYEKVSEEFQKIHKVLREKEEEIRETKEMYERLVLKKELDLNEAVIKMAALGSSLEETELKLQAKEELICKLGQGDMGTGAAMKDLQAKLVVAEDRIAELEQHLNDLQLGYSDLQMEHCKLQDDCDVLEGMSKQDKLSAAIEVPPEFADIQPKSKTYPDGVGSLSKRQRIRFSNIHCQKYVHTDGGEKMWTSNNSSDLSQGQSFSEESGSSDTQYHVTSVNSDPEKFISIIHTLETKLFATEEKLKDITLKLEHQQSRQLEAMVEQHGEMAKTETDLQEQLNESLSKVDQLTAQLRVEMDKRSAFTQETNCCLRTVNAKYEKALACVESSREKVQAILREPVEESMETQLRTLSEIETELVNATMYIREGGRTLDEQLEIQVGQKQEIENRLMEEEKIKLFAKTLAFEALVLNRMAFSIQNPNVDLLQSLNEIHVEAEKLNRSDEGYVAVEYADVLTRKLIIESEFWTAVEKLEAQFEVSEGRRQSYTDSVGVNVVYDESFTLINNACIKSELAFAVENLKHFYEEKLQKLKGDLAEVCTKLQQRELALTEIVKASNRSESAIQEVNDDLAFSQQMTDSVPPELDPFIKQIKVEEAHELANEMVSRHLQDAVPSCSIEDVDSLRMGRDRLVAELLRQSKILQYLSQEVEATCKVACGTSLGRIVQIFSAHPSYRNPDVAGGTLCMREAMIQAQIAYVACKLRADHERELKLCREACQSMDILCQEHARNVATIREQYEASLLEERQNFNQTITSLQEENGALQGEVTRRITELSQQQERLAQLEAHYCREMEHLKARYEHELNQVEQGRATTELALMEKTADSQRKLEVILMDIEKMEDRHEEHVQKLEDKFHGKIQELQRIHEEEMQQLHSHYTQTIRTMEETLEKLKARNPEGTSLLKEVSPMTDHTWPMEQDTSEVSQADRDSMMLLRDRIQELETQMNTMKDELENKHLEGDLSSLKEKYQKDFENLKATCERGFAAMEETHQKVIEDIQRQHQREVAKLLEERERLLAEETAATIAAIEAMKNAHREEMEKTQRSQLGSMSADIDELRQQYEEELQSIHRELEVLSEQYSQKCLENAHLAQALEAERQALRQCQRENQELHAHNQELNNRLAVEITRMRSCIAGDLAESPFTQGKDLYELEVLLRVKESEIQYLKQEIHSLKDELQSALRDKKYTADKYKDIYTELSIVKAKADCDISKLKEQLMAATEALGERNADGATAVAGYDIMKSKSNPDFLKERSSLSRQIRGVRSKSVIEQVSWDS